METSMPVQTMSVQISRQKQRFVGLYTVFLATVSVLFFTSSTTVQGSDSTASTPAVIELFTSHGCSSCPPADELFSDLIAQDPSIVALEYHVDYWDTLIHGNAGSFKDPFSDPDYTLRQRAYNQQRLQGRRGVYTPQMIVNGRYVTVGSQGRYVQHGLETAQRPNIKLTVEKAPGASAGGAGLRVKLQDAGSAQLPRGTKLWLAVFDRERETEITGGENKNLTLINHHIVREFREIWSPGDPSTVADDASGLVIDTTVALGEGQGCAVLLQPVSPGLSPGPIHAAGYCPL